MVKYGEVPNFLRWQELLTLNFLSFSVQVAMGFDIFDVTESDLSIPGPNL